MKKFISLFWTQRTRLSQTSLRRIIVFPFLVQIFLAVGLTGYFSIQNGQTAIDKLAMHLQTQARERIENYLEGYLALPHQINALNLRAIESGLLDPKDFQKMGQTFWNQAQEFEVGYVNFGNIQGEFIGAGFEAGEMRIDEKIGKQPLKSYTTDAQGNRISLASVRPDININDSDWYTQAVDAQKPIWSDIYNWPDFPNILSVSASSPVFDGNRELLGVLGVDLILSDINDFLGKFTVSPSGKTFILENNGLLVASSTVQSPWMLDQDKAERIKASEFQDPVIKNTTQYLISQFSNLENIQTYQRRKVTIDHQPQFLQVIPWKDKFGLNWLAIIVIPESDFMAQIHTNTRTTILLCLLALMISTWVGLQTSKWITHRIMRLIRASEAMAEGNLDQHIDRLGIRELDVLARAFNQMAEKLKSSFADLEQSNSELETRVLQRTRELSQTLQNLQNTQSQLIQTEKMSGLGQLVAGVAHEINNPVNFIYGNLYPAEEYTKQLIELIDLYQEIYPQPDQEIQELIEEIDLNFLKQDISNLFSSMKIGADRIREIVISLRNFSRLDESEFKKANIHEGIESTLMILHHRLKPKPKSSAIAVIKDYAQIPLVECYVGQLNQVFMNLLSNAIDALEAVNIANPQICIRTEILEENWLTIRIVDNGSGIPENIRSKLFDPFFTTKPVGKGTGLGLSISYQIIVDRHAGRLFCHSELGKGSEFIIEIPIRQYVG